MRMNVKSPLLHLKIQSKKNSENKECSIFEIQKILNDNTL